jgi:hypothetical protein
MYEKCRKYNKDKNVDFVVELSHQRQEERKTEG